MEIGVFYRLRLDTEREEQLLKYVKDRRYSFMLIFYLTLAYVAFGAVFAINDFMNAMNNSGGGFLEQESVSDMMMLALRRRRYYAGEFFLTWMAGVIWLIIGFIRGFGKIFGPNSDYDCVKNMKYEYGYMLMGGKPEGIDKHPYFVKDSLDNVYICPVFLDYRNAKSGDRLFCVVLDNGVRYAMLDKASSAWWEED